MTCQTNPQTTRDREEPYATFDGYAAEHCGDLIPQDEFSRYANRASDLIDYYTFDRVKEALAVYPEAPVPRVIRNTVYNVAEHLYKTDQRAGVKAEAVGAVHVEYTDASERTTDTRARDLIRQGLAHTGFLYRGL